MDGLPAGYRLQPKYTPEEIRQRRIAREQNAAAVGVQAEPAAPRARDGDDDPGPDDDPENRLRGIWWCVCENCREVPKNPSVRMCVCCQEQNFTGLTEKLEQPEIKCITLHADFDAMCKTEAVLEMMLAMSREKRGYLVNDNWTNRLYRLLAYQSYTYWVHRRLGKSVRKVVPACVVNAIRANWPEANPNNYVSYKDPDDDELIDAWAI